MVCRVDLAKSEPLMVAIVWSTLMNVCICSRSFQKLACTTFTARLDTDTVLSRRGIGTSSSHCPRVGIVYACRRRADQPSWLRMRTMMEHHSEINTSLLQALYIWASTFLDSLGHSSRLFAARHFALRHSTDFSSFTITVLGHLDIFLR